MARALRGGGCGGSDKGSGPYTGCLQDIRGGGGLVQAQTTAHLAEMPAKAKQRDTTQEIIVMPRQNMFEKKRSRPICGPSPTVTIFGWELSPQLEGPGVLPRS